MKTVVWLAANTLRWLTVLAVLAWLNPQPLHMASVVPVDATAPWVRTIQLAPCPAWTTSLGRWSGAYVCASFPGAQARYLHARWRHR